jgi:ribonuclease HII
VAVSLAHESLLWDAGALIVAGIDEVGRGALAGPVSVGVVAVTRCQTWPDGLADSKELPVPARLAMADALLGFGIGRAVGHSTAAEVDDRGIIGALRLAATRALATLALSGIAPDAILLDGRHDWLTEPEPDLFAELTVAGARAVRQPGDPEPASAPVTMVVKGDGLCASIAAASVLAKVERDALMRAAHAEHPHYGWDGNKGYGAAEHLEALRTRGPSPLHRVSWRLPATSECRVPA